MRLLLILTLAPALFAATYLVPTDAELIQGADDVVIATTLATVSERDARGAIVTRVTLRVEETLKGPLAPGAHLVLIEPGGAIGDRSRIIFGAPRYTPGVRYLVFTSSNRDLERTTSGMSLGQFELRDGIAVRAGIHGFDTNLAAHVERTRDATRFARFIRDVVAQRYSAADYFVSATRSESVATQALLRYTRSSYLLEDGGVGYRWKSPSIEWVRNGTQPGADGASAVLQGLAQWNATDSDIDLRDGGVDPDAVLGVNPDDGRNAVLFNDPDNEIPDNSGVIGVGGASGGTEYTYNGETFVEILEGDVVVANRSFTQSCLDTILSHELGHTLGIRHSNEPARGTQCGSTAHCTGDAVMNSGIRCTWNGVLKGWDHNAAATVYGDGVECQPLAIVEQPQSETLRRGEVIRLEVTATGTEPLRYEWFEGESGEVTNPVGTGTRLLLLPAGRHFTTRFWVRITNDCDTMDSEAAIVTIPVRRRSARH